MSFQGYHNNESNMFINAEKSLTKKTCEEKILETELMEKINTFVFVESNVCNVMISTYVQRLYGRETYPIIDDVTVLLLSSSKNVLPPS